MSKHCWYEYFQNSQ